MADEDLRDRERRGGDDPEAAAAHLVARVRAGALPRERVGVLACLAEPAALLAWEELGEELPPTWTEVEASLAHVQNPASRQLATTRRYRARWSERLGRLGVEASVRLALAAAESCEAERGPLATVSVAALRALELARAWVEGERRDLEDYEAAALAAIAAGSPAAGCAARAAGALTPASAADYASWAMNHLLGGLGWDVPAASARVRAPLLPWLFGEA